MRGYSSIISTIIGFDFSSVGSTFARRRKGVSKFIIGRKSIQPKNEEEE